MNTEQSPRLPLMNHLVTIRKNSGPLPLGGSVSAHYDHMHDDYLHEVDGMETYEVPLDVIAALAVEHKDQPAKFDALMCVLADRGVHFSGAAFADGKTEAPELFYQGVDEIERGNPRSRVPCQTFVKTADGKVIFPLCLHKMSMRLAHHHLHKTKPKSDADFKGGKHSRDALEVLELLLGKIGVRPNHEAIRSGYCKGCKRGA